MSLLSKIGKRIAHYLAQERESGRSVATCTLQQLSDTLEPGDVLLVEGNSRFSSAIKYITQSTWSHSALYIGDRGYKDDDKSLVLLEADVVDGVRLMPLSHYDGYHTRICRPVGLVEEEIDELIQFLIECIGYHYDLKNIFDLARFFLHPPPVPKKWRRQLLALGSGDPTRAICSSLIAQAFQHVNYPILPERITECLSVNGNEEICREYYHIRHHSLFAPRDFDVSPYFEIVKPTIHKDFDPHELSWATDEQLRQFELRF